MRPARSAAAVVASAVLSATVALGCPGPAAAASTQPGPTQVLNDVGSSANAMIKDNYGQRYRLKRNDYVLHDSETQYFTRFYVPRGALVRIYATDPKGVPLPGLLQQETDPGWHETNDQVDDADLVLIKISSTLTPV